MLSIRHASPATSFKLQYFILIAVIVVAGLSQGMLLPVLSILLDRMGVPPSLNGLNAAALYIGSFAMTVIAERTLGFLGFKKLIAGGLALVLVTVLVFPLIPDVRLWFVLRLLVGVGDSALHYSTQLWVLMMTPPETRGRNISFYGMSYGLGFSLGPLGIKLLDWGMAVPFILMAILLLIVLVCALCWLPNAHPEAHETAAKPDRARYRKSYSWAWYALLPAFLYGYMEASMNSNFPLYGLRIGYTESQISALMPFLGLGGLLMQLPLGIWSDRWGRKKVLIISALAGGVLFMLVPWSGTQFVWSMLLLAAAGGLVGSFFSLGLAYAADIMPRSLLPAANVVASFHFSIGSIAGPNLGGLLLDYTVPGSLFLLLGAFYILFGLLGVGFRSRKLEAS